LSEPPPTGPTTLTGPVLAQGERPSFTPGDAVRVLTRSPIGHYRVPMYLRGKAGTVEAVIEPIANLSYYERWVVAFANIAFEKGILSPGELAQKMDELRSRWNS